MKSHSNSSSSSSSEEMIPASKFSLFPRAKLGESSHLTASDINFTAQANYHNSTINWYGSQKVPLKPGKKEEKKPKYNLKNRLKASGIDSIIDKLIFSKKFKEIVLENIIHEIYAKSKIIDSMSITNSYDHEKAILPLIHSRIKEILDLIDKSVNYIEGFPIEEYCLLKIIKPNLPEPKKIDENVLILQLKENGYCIFWRHNNQVIHNKLIDKENNQNDYILELMSDNQLKEKVIEFECTDESFKYRVIGLDKQEKVGLIRWDKFPTNFPRDGNKILSEKNNLLPKILLITSAMGHTLKNIIERLPSMGSESSDKELLKTIINKCDCINSKLNEKNNAKAILITLEQLFRQVKFEILERIQLQEEKKIISSNMLADGAAMVENITMSDLIIKTLQTTKEAYSEKVCECFISYAWPTNGENKECREGMSNFLKLLKRHLEHAGITVYVDVLDTNFKKNIIEFYQQADPNHITLLVVENFLLKKYQQEFDSFYTGLCKFRKKKCEDKNFNTPPKIIPILLDNVDTESYFAKKFELYPIRQNWYRESYINNLKNLIKIIYNESSTSKKYESFWINVENYLIKKRQEEEKQLTRHGDRKSNHGIRDSFALTTSEARKAPSHRVPATAESGAQEQDSGNLNEWMQNDRDQTFVVPHENILGTMTETHHEHHSHTFGESSNFSLLQTDKEEKGSDLQIRSNFDSSSEESFDREQFEKDVQEIEDKKQGVFDNQERLADFFSTVSLQEALHQIEENLGIEGTEKIIFEEDLVGSTIESAGETSMLSTTDDESKYYDAIVEIGTQYSFGDLIDLKNLAWELNNLIAFKSTKYLPKIRELLSNSKFYKKTLLHAAVEQKNVEMVKLLLKFTSELINAQDESGNTPLHYSAANNLEHISFLLMAAGADISIGNADAFSPVRIAADKGALNVIKIFLTNHKVDFSYPLYFAICNNRIEVAQEILLYASIDLNKKIALSNSLSDTYLAIACEMGNRKTVEMLLHDETINVNLPRVVLEKGIKLERKPLHLAILKNHPVIISLLLNHPKVEIDNYAFYLIASTGNDNILKKLLVQCQKTIDINHIVSDSEDVDYAHDRALVAACRQGKESTVTILLNQPQIDIDAFGKEQLPPIFIACQNNYINIFELLLKRKNRQLIMEGGETILHFCVRNKISIDFINIILNAKAINVNSKDNHGFTVLHLACRKNYVEAIKLLLPLADVNLCSSNEFSPLHEAFKQGNLSLIEMLLSHKDIDINVLAGKNSVAHTAMRYKYYEGVKFLLEKSKISNINHPGKNDFTLLHLVCQHGHAELLDQLLKNDKLYLLPNSDNYYPIYYLIEDDKFEMFKKLFSHNLEQNVTVSTKFSPLIQIFYYALNKKATQIHTWLYGEIKSKSINLIDFFSQLVMFAIHHQRPEIIQSIKHLISSEESISIEERDKLYISMAYYSIECKRFDIALLFLDKENKEINYIPENIQFSLLYFSLEKSAHEVTNVLLDYEYIDINLGFKDKHNGIPPLYLIAIIELKEKTENKEKNQALIDKFTNNTKLDLFKPIVKDGKTLLIWDIATKFNKKNLVNKLLNHPSVTKHYSIEFLFEYAYKQKYDDLVKKFLSSMKLKIDFENRDNLLIAAINGNGEDYLSFLLGCYKKQFNDFKDIPFDNKVKLAAALIKKEYSQISFSDEKKEACHKLFYEICADGQSLSKFINLNFEALGLCSNKDSIFRVLKASPESTFASLLTDTISPRGIVLGSWTCGETNTFKTICTLHNKLKPTLTLIMSVSPINAIPTVKIVSFKEKSELFKSECTLISISMEKKEICNKLFHEICTNEQSLNMFIDLNFEEFRLCQNKESIFKVLKISVENVFINLLADAISPRGYMFGSATCGGTSTFKAIVDFQNNMKSKLMALNSIVPLVDSHAANPNTFFVSKDKVDIIKLLEQATVSLRRESKQVEIIFGDIHLLKQFQSALLEKSINVTAENKVFDEQTKYFLNLNSVQYDTLLGEDAFSQLYMQNETITSAKK